MNNSKRDLLFDHVLAKAYDITNEFDVNLGGLPELILETTQHTQPFIERVREVMEKLRLEPGQTSSDPKRLIDLATWIADKAPQFRELLSTGQVAAVDGTPLMSPQRYLAGQVYACAVGTVTSTQALRLRAHIVKTIAPLNPLQTERKVPVRLEDIQKLIAQSDELLGDTSWPLAFLEYQVRHYAMQLENPYIFIDGPLVPENLATRKRGRELISKMLHRKDKVFVGVIKSLTNSRAIYRLAARALKPGELYVLETQRDALLYEMPEDRFVDYREWVEEELGVVLRGVYRPGAKSFGFQCHIRDFDTAVALMWLDRDYGVPGHEIPFLLNQVDGQLRSRYRSADTLAAIDGLLARQGEDYFFDESDERSFR